jgi:hypothetical protein
MTINESHRIVSAVKMTPRATLVYTALAKCSNKANRCFLNLNTLAKDTHTDTKPVQRRLATSLRWEWLKRTKGENL